MSAALAVVALLCSAAPVTVREGAPPPTGPSARGHGQPDTGAPGTQLTVRVLEREHLTRAELTGALTCGGAPLPSAPRVLEVVHGELLADGAPCPAATVTGPVTLRTQDLTRTFPGTLRAAAEGSFLRLVVTLDVEAYLPAVVTAELDDAPRAALEAQAVVSRTFALASRRRHGEVDLCDLAHCQVYRGEEGVGAATRLAVQATQGQVLLAGGVKLEPAYFHAACGGRTSRPADVFRQEGAAPGVADAVQGRAACADAPGLEWEHVTPREELAKAVGARDEGTPVEVLRRDEAGRVLELRAFGVRLSGTEFVSRVGRAQGWQAVRSARFWAQTAEGQVRLRGSGLGHGVGLCQWGARGLATRGASASDLLKRYFPQSTVRSWNVPLETGPAAGPASR